MKNLLFDVVHPPTHMKAMPQVAIFLKDRDSFHKVHKDQLRAKRCDADVVLGGLDRALKQFKEMKSPQVIVVDISGEDLPITRLKELREVCANDTKFIIVGEVDRVSLYRDLMGFGAVEYLIKPIPFQLLQETIAQAFEEPLKPSKRDISARNIAIVGAGGGIGTTSIVSSLGDVLAVNLKRKTLLLDCQIDSPALGSHFNKKISNGLGALCANPTRLDKLLVSRNVEKIEERLDLLCIDGINEATALQLYRNIAALYPLISESYHYILSDIGYAAFNDLMESGTNFTSVIFVSDMRLSSLVNLQRRLKAFSEKKRTPEIIIVLNQSHSSKSLQVSAKQVKQFLNRSPDVYLRHDLKSFAKSTIKGIPLARVRGNFQKDIQVIADLLTHHRIPKNAPLWDANRRRV